MVNALNVFTEGPVAWALRWRCAWVYPVSRRTMVTKRHQAVRRGHEARSPAVKRTVLTILVALGLFGAAAETARLGGLATTESLDALQLRPGAVAWLRSTVSATVMTSFFRTAPLGWWGKAVACWGHTSTLTRDGSTTAA